MEFAGKRIYVSGVFDLFHYGHMKLINVCKLKFPGAEIVVGVHNDQDCAYYKRIPVMSHEERVLTIRESGMVSEVLENAPLRESGKFYEEHCLDIIVHAHSQEEHEYYVSNFYEYAEEKGMLRRIDYTPSISSTKIIGRLKKNIDTF